MEAYCVQAYAKSNIKPMMVTVKMKNVEIDRDKVFVVACSIAQGRSQPHRPGWAKVPLSSFFPQILIKFSYFSSNFPHILPHFGPPGGRVVHPQRPWLRHWHSTTIGIVRFTWKNKGLLVLIVSIVIISLKRFISHEPQTKINLLSIRLVNLKVFFLRVTEQGWSLLKQEFPKFLWWC